MNSAAIIGAGPGGLVAAKYLQQAGFTTTLFDEADGVGGQWRVGAPHSKAWPGMRTNTSRVLTAFSDLAHEPGTAVYPSVEQMGAYLARYADRFALLAHARFGTRVERVARDGDGWLVRARGADGGSHVERFSHVVVATGWNGRPVMPAVPGLATFTGRGGATHTVAYRGASRFRDLRVVVAGGGISALEVASELAQQGAARVIVASRRQRYVVQKLLAGVPADHLAFTRFAARAGESFPPEAVMAAMSALVVGRCGSPEQVGAPRPVGNFFEAGLTLSQSYLPLVAEGRIEPRGWLTRVAGDSAHFADGSTAEVDAIVFGTGYAPELSFLDAPVRAELGMDEDDPCAAPELFRFTFHPALPGLACLGLLEQIGPHFPTLELQARWIAYTWSGRVPAPSPEQMRGGIAAARARAASAPTMAGHGVPMHVSARMFAAAAGVEPDAAAWPALIRALFFGPLSPASFRLSGPDALPAAAARVAADAAAFGAGADGALTPEQRGQLAALAAASGDRALAELVARFAEPAVRAPADVAIGARRDTAAVS